MRTLHPKNDNESTVSQNEGARLQSQIDALVRGLADTNEELNLSEQELDSYKEDNRAAFSTGTLTATDTTTDDLHTQHADIGTLDGGSVNVTKITATQQIVGDSVSGTTGSFGNLEADEGQIQNLNVTGTVKANTLDVDNYTVDRETIGEAVIGSADITEANVETGNVSSLTSSEAEIDSLTSDVINTHLIYAAELVGDVKSNIISADEKIIADKDVYGLQQITNNTPVWIKLPIVNTGRYLLQVYNNDKSEWYFGVNITFAGNDNATIQYSEKSWTEEPQYLGNTIYLYEGNLYFECRQSHSRILWRYETSDGNDLFDAPQTSENLPINPESAERFMVKTEKGTIFTRYVQIGMDGGTRVLTLSPVSWVESTDTPVQYDTLDDVSFGFYAPDQNLDKGASPEFHTIKLDTEGKTVVRATEEGVVYTQEEASVDNGTLVPEPKLIEAEELYEYNGNSYDIVTRTTAGDWIILPAEANPMKAETTAEDVNGYFWHYENEGGWTEITSNKLFSEPEYKQGFAWPHNNSDALLGFDLSGYTLDGTAFVPATGEYTLHSGDRFVIKICSDVWNSNACTRTYKLDPSVRGSAISESYSGDWFAHSTSKNFLMKNIYASGDTRNAVSTFTNEGNESGLNLNFTNAFSLVNSFYNKLAGTSNVNNLCILKQGNNYFITKARSASWSFTQKVVNCFNGVYTSLNAAVNAFFNQTYSGTQSVTLTSNVDWFYPMILGEACSTGTGQVCTDLTAYRYKRTIQNNVKRFIDDTATPLDSHFANTTANSQYYFPRNDGKWTPITNISTSLGSTTVTIGEPYGLKGNTITGTPTVELYNLNYNSDGTFNYGNYDPNVITPPATLNKLYEVVKVPKGDVEYGAVTETAIDYTSTGHPIKNLGDGTIVYGSATVGTNLTVNRNTILGNDEGVIDPDTQQPIHTSTEVKGDLTAGTSASDSFTANSIAYFNNGLEVGSVSKPRHAHHYGGIYRYNFDTNTDEEINSTYQRVDGKGVANGYAPLDENARIPRQHMPYDVMEYRGSWDASTGIFPQGTAQDPLQIGDTYKVSVAGTIDGQYYGVNDEITYNGSTWDYYENNKVILGTTDLGVVGCMWLG